MVGSPTRLVDPRVCVDRMTIVWLMDGKLRQQTFRWLTGTGTSAVLALTGAIGMSRR
jgi:hypothetical protein